MDGEPDVRYGLEVLGDSIPGREGRTGDGNSRYSPLRDQIDKIREDERLHHKWVAIADYSSGSVAGGAMRDLKHHYGDIPEVSGLTFTTHRYAVRDDDDEVKRDDKDRVVKRCKLVARFDPDRINPGRRRQWERNQIMARGREAARKLGIDVDAVQPERRDPDENDGSSDYVPGMRLPRP